MGPGITRQSVTVGLTYADPGEANSYVSTFGMQGLEQGDAAAQARAVRAYINSQGGIAAGRRLELVLHQFDLSGSLASNAQASCADYTQDHQVFAGFSMLQESYPNDTLASCLDKAGVIALPGSLVAGSAPAFFDRYPNSYFAPGGIESIAAARTYVDGLHSVGYFGRSPRIGLLYIDDTSFVDAWRRGIVPALALHGLKLTDAVGTPPARTASEASSTVASVQNAVLRFRSNSIDHVLFLDSGGGLAQYFMTGAANQQYTPRYGLSSDSSPVLLAANAPEGQLDSAVAVGWTPTHDVDRSRQPATPATRLCDQIMRQAGIQPVSEADRWVMYSLCSGLFFLRDAMNAAPTLTRAGFRAAVERLGARGPAAAVGHTERFGPRKHWGAAAYRLLAYQPSCRCFAYTSADRPIP